MSEATEPAPTASVLSHCCVCDVRLIGGTAVSILEQGSGPGRILRACGPCVKRRNLLPLDEQETPVGDGRLVFRSGRRQQ